MATREERFGVILDVIAHVTGTADPNVLDLGCGPGSLAGRVLDHFPGGRVVAVDTDPVLQLLGRKAYGDSDGRLTWVLADLGSGWSDAITSAGPYDAVVSTTALHWLQPDLLVRCLTQAGEVLRAGGVFVNGDHQVEPGQPRIAELQRSLRRIPANRRHEYRPWYEALQAIDDPEMAAAVQAREERGAGHPHDENSAMLGFHEAALRQAGFTEVGCVWQQGDDRVLVGLRPAG